MTEPIGGGGLPERPTVGLLSPCGWGNLGDAAIQDVTIAAVRSRWPEARIVAFTSNPGDTRRRHGIAAFPLSGFERPAYSIAERPLPRSAAPIDRALQQLQKIRGFWRAGGVARATSDFVQSETLHWAMARRWLREMDVLIVSGGGQLDDYWGGTWGHPYALWKWTVLARRARTPVLMLSVGMGTLRTALARSFVRGALGRTAYRSFRDQRTRTRVSRLLGLSDAGPVVPDLAFGLESAPSRGGAQPAGIVGISPIAYCDPRVWPRKDAAVYQAYVARLAELLGRLAAAGRRVVLFSTDGPDRVVMQDVWAAAGSPPSAERTCTETVADLFSALARIDVVVASRLHGVILAQLAGCPVVALSYDWKVAQHMDDVGQSAYCLDIDAFDVPGLAAALDGVESRRDELRVSLGRELADRRRRVQRQFDEVLR